MSVTPKITSGFVGVKTSYSITTEGKTTGCGCVETEEPDSNTSLIMLYPTKHDIDTIAVEGDVPIPLSGGAILKVPGVPDHPKHDENNEDIKKINNIITELKDDAGVKAALDLTDEERELFESWKSDPSSKPPPEPKYMDVSKAKKEVNRVLINKIAKKKSLVSGYEDLKDLVVRVCTANVDDPSKLETGDDCSIDLENIEPCFDLTYIPLNVLSGSTSIAGMFGEKFVNVPSTCGNTYDVIANYVGSSEDSSEAGFSGTNVLTQDGDIETAVESIKNSLGAGLDILALLANLFNLDFFPIDLEEIIKELAGQALGELAGMLGIEFPEGGEDEARSAILSKLEDIVSDAQMREILLEFFPIQNVDPSLIRGGGGFEPPSIGFYTLQDGQAYIKLPNMSCMDSAWFSDDDPFYETNDESGEVELKRVFFIEVHFNEKISRWGFLPQPSPTPTIYGDSELPFPDTNDIEILVDNIQGQDIAGYYLSPIAEPSGELALDGFQGNPDSVGREIFTAPKITKFLFSPSKDGQKDEGPYDTYKTYIFDAIESAANRNADDDSNGSLGSLFGVTMKDEDNISVHLNSEANGLAEIFLNIANGMMITAFVQYELGETDAARGTAATAQTFYDKASAILNAVDEEEEIALVDVGFPITDPTSHFGGDAKYLIAEKSRPDVVLAPLDAGLTSASEKNNELYYEPKLSGTSTLFSSNRPRFCGTAHIPSFFWIPCSISGSDPDGRHKVKISAEDLKLRFNKKRIKLALYAIDTMGQISRAPGRLISLTELPPSIDEILPSGCAGGGVIKMDTWLQLRIMGSNLGNVTKITFGEAEEITFNAKGSADYNVSISEDSIMISTSSATKTFYADFDFSTGRYPCKLYSPEGYTNQEVSIYVSRDDETDLPVTCSSSLAYIPSNSFKAPGFKEHIYGVPLHLDGLNNSSIEIKAKSKLFSGRYNGIYSYLAVLDEEGVADSCDLFSFPEDRINLFIKDTNGEDRSIILIKTIENEFTAAGISGFYKKPSFFGGGKKAILEFPGKHKSLNFTNLLNSNITSFIVVTNRRIDEYGYTDADDMDEGTYSTVMIKSKEDDDGNIIPGFIPSPRIIGILGLVPEKVSDGGDTYDGYNTLPIDIFSKLNSNGFIKNKLGFGSSRLAHRAVKTQGYFQNLVIIFQGSILAPKPNKSYSFHWGATATKKTNLKKKFLTGIKEVPGMPGYLYARFRDVSTKEIGPIGLFLTHKDRIFNPASIYSSQKLYFKATTSDIEFVDSDIDPETMELITGSSVSEMMDTFFSEPAGPVNDSKTIEIDNGANHYLVPMGVQSSVAMSIPGNQRSNPFTSALALDPDSPISDAISLSKGQLMSIEEDTRVPSGHFFTNGETVDGVKQSDAARFVATLSISPNQPAWVMPEIYKIQIGEDIATTDEQMLALDWSKATDNTAKVSARGAGLTKHWNVVLDIGAVGTGGTGAEPLETVSVKKNRPGDYTFNAKLTDRLIGVLSAKPGTACFPALALSDTNARFNSAEKKLGSAVHLDMATVMKNLVSGPHKNKRRKPGVFKDLPPLNLLPLKINLPAINPKLLQSFCDFSFHLTGELKVHLEQFYILCIPIQVLLCIIDVICALMNPFKTVLAIIRLFECLFDLLLLLPQISVPVMYLNLILHLLEILECIIRKILWLILAINALVIAFRNAIPRDPETGDVDYRYIDWDAIQALEETLAEYLFEMEADLDFLGPVMSVLGMFLQLLQLLFRFPCRINPSGGSFICGIDGTLLGGLIRGKAMPGEGSIDPNYLLPVAQAYSQYSAMPGVGSTDDSRTASCFETTRMFLPHVTMSKTYAQITSKYDTLLSNILDIEPGEDGAPGDGERWHKSTYRTVGVDEDGNEFGAGSDKRKLTFTASATKSVAGFSLFESDPKFTTFHFSSTYEGGCFFGFEFPTYIDSYRPADSFLVLFDESESDTKLKTTSEGNFISPHDGYAFLKNMETDSDGNKFRRVKPLTVTFEWSEFTVNPDTGEMEEEIKSVTNTYDEIPSIAMVDGNGDVYFPTKFYYESSEESTIFGDKADEGASGSHVKRIEAKVINRDTAQMLSKSKEEKRKITADSQGEIDACGEDDGSEAYKDCIAEANENADYIDYKVLSYPQVMFFDMRQIEQELEDLCMPAQMNAEVIPDEEPDELITIVEDTQACIQEFIDQVLEQRNAILEALEQTPPGDDQTWLQVPDIPEFDVDVFTLNGQNLKDCLNDGIDKICKFVINPLTTSFKVLEDSDVASVGDLFPELALSETYSDGAATMLGLTPAPPITAETLIDPDPSITEDEFLEGSRFIGAREYAAGIGDNAVVEAGGEVTIQITPRDIYNAIIHENANLIPKIELEIISDETGEAEFELFTWSEEGGGDGEAYNIYKDGGLYKAKLSSSKPGTVKLRASICSKTIKAFANAGLSTEAEVEVDVDCIDPATTEEEVSVSAVGGIVKVDRILTILFVRQVSSKVREADDDAGLAKPNPQTFGTKLEN